MSKNRAKINRNNILVQKLNKTKNFFYSTFAFFIFTPFILNAQIEITEIMYDLEEGSDSDDEVVKAVNAVPEKIIKTKKNKASTAANTTKRLKAKLDA